MERISATVLTTEKSEKLPNTSGLEGGTIKPEIDLKILTREIVFIYAKEAAL